MKRAGFYAPFILLLGAHVASHWVDESHLIGDLWAASFLACLLCVPVLSRRRLWLGYAALLFPFALLALQLTLDWGSLSVGYP